MPIRAVVPKGLIVNPDALTRAIFAAMDEECGTMIKDFEKTTQTWDHKVEFYQVAAQLSGSKAIAAAGTDDDIYRFVSRGTQPHLITPSDDSGFLAFQTGYGDKTSKGIKGIEDGAQPGGHFGDFVYAKQVQHPGNSPRLFEEAMQALHRDSFKDRIAAAIAREVGD